MPLMIYFTEIMTRQSDRSATTVDILCLRPALLTVQSSSITAESTSELLSSLLVCITGMDVNSTCENYCQ